jgi:hypothetical protein
MTAIVHDFSQFTAGTLHREFRLTFQVPDESPSGKAKESPPPVTHKTGKQLLTRLYWLGKNQCLLGGTFESPYGTRKRLGDGARGEGLVVGPW